MRVGRLLFGMALLALASGCADEPKAPFRREPLPPPPGPIADAGEWASRMGSAPAAQASGRKPAVPFLARAARATSSSMDPSLDGGGFAGCAPDASRTGREGGSKIDPCENEPPTASSHPGP